MPTALRTHRRERPGEQQRVQRAYDDRRGTAHQRGYGTKWRAYVRTFRGRYPLCGMRPPGAPATPDSRCAAAGQPTPMLVVDHIRPVTGADDPAFYCATNHQSLCERCHNAKRNREARRGHVQS